MNHISEYEGYFDNGIIETCCLIGENKLSIDHADDISIKNILYKYNWYAQKKELILQIEKEIKKSLKEEIKYKGHNKMRKKHSPEYEANRLSFEKSFAAYKTEQNELEKALNPNLYNTWENKEKTDKKKKPRPYLRNVLYTSTECDWSILYKICSGTICRKVFPFIVVMLLCNTDVRAFDIIRRQIKKNNDSFRDYQNKKDNQIIDFLITVQHAQNRERINKNTNNSVLLLQAKLISVINTEICQGENVDCGLCLAWLFDSFPELEYYTDYCELKIIKQMIINSLTKITSQNEYLRNELCTIYNYNHLVELKDFDITSIPELKEKKEISEEELMEICKTYNVLRNENPILFKSIYTNIISECYSLESDVSKWIPQVYFSLEINAMAKYNSEIKYLSENIETEEQKTEDQNEECRKAEDPSTENQNEDAAKTTEDQNTGNPKSYVAVKKLTNLILHYDLLNFEFVRINEDLLYPLHHHFFEMLFKEMQEDLIFSGTIKINQAMLTLPSGNICNISSEKFCVNDAFFNDFVLTKGKRYIIKKNSLPFLSWAVLFDGNIVCNVANDIIKSDEAGADDESDANSSGDEADANAKLSTDEQSSAAKHCLNVRL